MQPLSKFMTDNRVRMSVFHADKNPNMEPWANARHFRCILTANNRTMTVYFSQGSAHTKQPTAADLLDCLASDASSVENARDLKDWCNDYGYDTDSRKAEKIYRTIKRQAAGLKRLFGEDAYTILLWGTERE